GISLVLCLLFFTYFLRQNSGNSMNKTGFARLKHLIQNFPKEHYFYLIPISIFSLYSLFLGSYNSIDLDNKISLSVLYAKLPEGIYYSFTQKLGFPILFLILTINVLIIH